MWLVPPPILTFSKGKHQVSNPTTGRIGIESDPLYSSPSFISESRMVHLALLIKSVQKVEASNMKVDVFVSDVARCIANSLAWRGDFRRCALLALVMLAAASLSPLAGCVKTMPSANTAHLKGKITLDGGPIPADARASITFKPTRSGQAKTTFASIIDGSYDSPETPKGLVKTYISIQQPTGKMISEAGGRPYAEMRSLVPASCMGGFDMDIDGDNLNKDFNLK